MVVGRIYQLRFLYEKKTAPSLKQWRGTMLNREIFMEQVNNNLHEHPTDTDHHHFYCKINKCWLRKSICIQRQEKAHEKGEIRIRIGMNTHQQVNLGMVFGQCIDCEQGRAIKKMWGWSI